MGFLTERATFFRLAKDTDTQGGTVEPLYKNIVGTRPYMLILQVCLYQGHMISPRDLRIIKINL
jgi:hypothetical protein